jgi:hypothetical protein
VGLAIAAAIAVAIAAARLPGAGIAPTSVEHGDAGSVLFLAAAIAAFALYVVAVAILGGRHATLSRVCAIAAVIQLLPLAGPLLQSRDVYAYWDYGRLAAEHDANPYVSAPDSYPSDPAYAAMAKAWRSTPSVYGPAFTVASAGIAEASGSSRAEAVWAYRLAAAAGMLVLVGLAAVRARRRALAAAVVGWNPLLALQSAGGGHNDVWMMAFVLAALVLADRGRTVLAGVSWAVAVFVKWIVLGLLPLAVLAARRQRTLWLAFATGAAALAAGASALFGTGWLTALSGAGGRRSAYSVPSRLSELGLPRSLALAVVAVGAAAVFAVLCRSAFRGRARLGAGAVLLLLVTPWLLPWYTVWAVPLAAADEDAAAPWLAIALSAYLLPDRVPL